MAGLVTESVTLLLAMQLADYLRTSGISDDDFGQMIGVNRQAVHRYKTFGRFPKRQVLAKIVEVTGGAVTANDLASPPLPEKQGAA